MTYQPTMFLPLHVVAEMNKVLMPIEKALRTLGVTPTLNETSQQIVDHDLRCFAEFRKTEQQLIEAYTANSTRAKSFA